MFEVDSDDNGRIGFCQIDSYLGDAAAVYDMMSDLIKKAEEAAPLQLYETRASTGGKRDNFARA